ncbi:MAG: amidohydrolase family protein [Gemmatimonadaceae bacterium]
MSRLTLALLLAGCAPAGPRTATPAMPPGTRTYALVGGQWFDGASFVPRTMYVVGEAFTAREPARVDSVVNLDGGYIVPPFGDAHTHNLDGALNLETVRNAYLAEGTFYVQVLTNTRTGAEAVRARRNRPGTLDVVYSHGGLTSTLGHPFMAYEPRAMGLRNPAVWKDHTEEIRKSRIRENNAYWFIDSLADLEAKWPAILSGKPDVIKVYLLDAEQYEVKRARAGLGENGLRADLVPEIVRRAHAAELRVWAHVNTAYDFGVAARAGVDGFAHLPAGVEPGRGPQRYLIQDADARVAARHGAAVAPTVEVRSRYARSDSARLQQIRDVMRRNLRLLRAHGVRIVVGSDMFGRTARSEVEALQALGVWDNTQLLTLWAETTPRVIFPERRIGRLLPDYEASLLVLDCNPIETFDCTEAIRLRMKQGRLIELPAVDSSAVSRP